MCNEDERKDAMKGFVLSLWEAVNDSPLGKIKGECRFPTHAPGDFDNEDSNFFDNNEVEIRFAYNHGNLGSIIRSIITDSLCSSTGGAVYSCCSEKNSSSSTSQLES